MLIIRYLYIKISKIYNNKFKYNNKFINKFIITKYNII